MSKFKVGDRIQLFINNSIINDGEILKFFPPKKEMPKDYYNYTLLEREEFQEYYLIRWEKNDENDSYESINPVSGLTFRDSEIEREFRNSANLILSQINLKLIQASELISEAESISDASGIPFSSGVSPLGQSYWPRSVMEKYPDLDKNFISDVTGAYTSYPDDSGWEHSMVC